MINIDLQNDTGFRAPSLDILQNAAKDILAKKKIEQDIEIGVKIVKPDSIRELNKKYRNIDKTTDVLSFPIYDELPNKTDKPILLGDIIVCPEAAKDDFIKLFKHSLLHLLGFHHN